MSDLDIFLDKADSKAIADGEAVPMAHCIGCGDYKEKREFGVIMCRDCEGKVEAQDREVFDELVPYFEDIQAKQKVTGPPREI